MRMCLLGLAATCVMGALADGEKIKVACIGDSITWGYAMTNRVSEAETVAFWPFGSWGYADASGHGLCLCADGDVSLADGAAVFGGGTGSCRTELPVDLRRCTRGLTVEFFVRRPAGAGPAEQMLVEQTRLSSASSATGAFYVVLDEGLVPGVNGMMKTVDGAHIDHADDSLGDGRWHHVAFVWDSLSSGDDRGRLYLDGALQSQDVRHRKTDVPSLVRDYIWLGSRAGESYRFRGELDDVRITAGPLSPEAFLKVRSEENGPLRAEAEFDAMAPRTAIRPPERQELLPLPVGAITARGWIKAMLERSRDGMGGHYGEFDPDQFELPGTTKDYDARLPGSDWSDVPGWCAEMSGEYRLGQFELAETLGDAGLQAKTRAWRDALLAGQEADGYLGAYRPQDNRLEDYNAWGAHFYYRTLLLEYSRTRDAKLLEALHRGLLWFVREWEGEKKTTYVGPTIIWPMIEVYMLTGDPRLLAFCEDYADLLDRIGENGGFTHLSLAKGVYHVVAFAVRAQLPGILSLANGDENLLKASASLLDEHIAQVGWQATYTPVADREHTSAPGCIGETEYCNFLCWMEYMQWLARLTGESRYGDLIERMAFNAAMGGRRKDERAIAYNTSPNQFRATKTSARAGCCSYYEVYCPCEFAACCTAQSIRLLPSYLLKSVMRTRDGDLAVNTYGPCHVEDGGVTLDLETDYPFEETVRLKVNAKDGWKGALRLRRPVWATGFTVTRNGAPCAVEAKDGWLALEGPWSHDEVVLTFGLKPVIRPVRERDMVEPLRAIEWGPLVFAQPLKETWTPVPDDPKSRPLPSGWPWYDVTCAEKPALYALPETIDSSSVRVRRVETAGAYPWEVPPVRLVVPMVRAPQAYASDPEQQEKNTPPVANPVAVGCKAKSEDVELVPFGATCLRTTCFPLAKPAEASEVIAFWPFGEFGLNDVSGNGHSLEAGTGVKVEDSVRLDGAQSVFKTASKLDLSPYNAVTVEFWMKIDPADNPGAAIFLEHSTNANSVVGAFMLDFNELPGGVLGVWRSAKGPCGADGGAGIADGNWHHVAFVVERNLNSDDASRLYIDKALYTRCTQFPFANTPGPVAFANETLYIGSRADGTLKLKGEIDNLRISAGALVPDDFVPRGDVVVAYWPFGNYQLSDASGNGHALEAGSGVTVRNSAKLDGTQSTFNTAESLDLSRYDAVTVEFWTKIDPADNPGAAIFLEHSTNANSVVGAFMLDFNELPGGVFGAWISANGGCGADGGAGIADGNWHHVAFVIEQNLNTDDASRLYIDRKFVSNRCTVYPGVNKPGPVAFANETLYIGSRANDSLKFKGEIDDVRVTGLALTPDCFLQRRTSTPAFSVMVCMENGMS